MSFLLNFFQIQKTHFNILPTDVVVPEAEQKMKRSYCKPVQSILKLEWMEVKEISPAVLRRVQIAHGGSQTHL